MENHQLLLANMDAIEAGVRRAGSRCRLSNVDVQDLIADAVLKLLEGGIKSFDPDKGSAETFFRVVAWRVTADRLRAMGRGGQFSGYLSGIGNTSLNTPKGARLELDAGESFAESFAERQWTEQARAEVAEVLSQLTEQERDLYALLASGDFDAATYAAEQGISHTTAHVRVNRLRAKIRAKLAA
jgi:RNA polymerase sigma factor (sigma-70 family)